MSFVLGSVPRPIAKKLSEHRSVMDFGAVGDGVADDSAAIQSAFDSAKGGVLFPSGTYNLNGHLIHLSRSNIKIEGRKGATILQTVNNVGGFLLASDGTAFVQVHDIHITGLTFTGAADGTGTNVSVAVNVNTPSTAYSRGVGGASNIYIDHCSFSGWTMGAMGTGVTGFSVTDCFFTGMRYVPALAAGGYGVLTQSCYGVIVANNHFVALPAGDRHAIYISCDGSKGSAYQTEDIQVIGNVIDWRTPTSVSHQESAIIIRSVFGAIISGNHIVGGYNQIGFATDAFGNSRDIVVSGNVLTDGLNSGVSSYSAIVFYYSTNTFSNVTVTGNTISQSLDYVFGVTLAGVINSVIANNAISVTGAASGMGIELYNCDTMQLGPNNLQGNGTAVYGIYNVGTNVRITQVPGVNIGFAAPIYNPSDPGISLLDVQTIPFVSPNSAPATDTRFTWDKSGSGAHHIGRQAGNETGNPALFLWGGDGSATSGRQGVLQVNPADRTLGIGAWNYLKLYANVPAGGIPTDGTLVAIFAHGAQGPYVTIGADINDGTHAVQIVGAATLSAADNVATSIVTNEAPQTLKNKNLSDPSNILPASTLPNVGTPGAQLPKVTTDSQGRVVSSAALVAADIPAAVRAPTTQTVGGHALNTTYQNTGGNTWIITVIVQTNTTNANLIAYTDASAAPTTVVAVQQLQTVIAGGPMIVSITFGVLPGNYYKVTHGGMTLYSWVELR